MKQGGIYEIVHTATGRRYIGSAVSFSTRWRLHLSHLRRGVHHSVVLQRAWNKYGAAAFAFRPLMVCFNRADLIPWEQRYLDEFKPEYNISHEARSCMGHTRTPEARAKAAASNKGQKRTPEQRANISRGAKGRICKPFTAAHLANMAAAQRGKVRGPHRPEVRAKMSALKLGVPWTPARRAAHEARA